MKERVLITGGAGFLGSILCEHLLKRGYPVTVVDSLIYGQNSLFHLCASPKFNFIFGDARDPDLMERLIPDADIIIPLTALVGAPACDRDPIAAKSINYEAVQMINNLRSSSQLVIYPNSNSGYGTHSGEIHCTEETPLEPISFYGKTKVRAEQELLATPNTITLRLATVFGASPRMRIDLLVNHFVYAAVTDGYIVIFEKEFKRNYIHIRDVADCFIHCIENAEIMIGRPYNVGLDEANFSKEELAGEIKKLIPDFYVHFSEVGSDPDKRNYIVSNQRLREVGFTASRTIENGIVELVKAYRMFGRAAFKNV